MNKVDVIIIAFAEFDSPITRDFIHRYHTKFNKISYVINVNNNGLSDTEKQYVEFISNDLKNKADVILHHLDGSMPHDWRSEPLVKLIKQSNADYVYSIEPDFVGDWDKIVDIMINRTYSLFTNYTAHQNGAVRLWPSFWGCKMELLKKLDMNFSSMPDARVLSLYGVNYNKMLTYDPPFVLARDTDFSEPINMLKDKRLCVRSVDSPSYDHFDYISTQIVDMVGDDDKEILLLNRMNDIWWEHITGITFDFVSMHRDGKTTRSSKVYKKFYDLCMRCNVNIFDKWSNVSNAILNQNN